MQCQSLYRGHTGPWDVGGPLATLVSPVCACVYICVCVCVCVCVYVCVCTCVYVCMTVFLCFVCFVVE